MMPKGYTVKLKRIAAKLVKENDALRQSHERSGLALGEREIAIKGLMEEVRQLTLAKDAYATGNASMERTISALQTEAQRLRRVNQALSILVVEGASDALRSALASRLRDDTENQREQAFIKEVSIAS